MPTDAFELRNRLLQSNDEFRQLATQHQDLDQRLTNLSHKTYLSDSEQIEETQLKKRKLHLKDRMEDILRRHRAVSL
jgi:phosphatidylserine decarboxylase